MVICFVTSDCRCCSRSEDSPGWIHICRGHRALQRSLGRCHRWIVIWSFDRHFLRPSWFSGARHEPFMKLQEKVESPWKSKIPLISVSQICWALGSLLMSSGGTNLSRCSVDVRVSYFNIIYNLTYFKFGGSREMLSFWVIAISSLTRIALVIEVWRGSGERVRKGSHVFPPSKPWRIFDQNPMVAFFSFV